MSLRDRRLAPRATTEVRIDWTVPRRRRRQWVDVAEAAIVSNASMSGLQIRANTVERFVPGNVVPISCEGQNGRVNIRWIGPSGERGLSLYGVKLVYPSSELLEVLLRGTGLLHPSSTEVDDSVLSLLVLEPSR